MREPKNKTIIVEQYFKKNTDIDNIRQIFKFFVDKIVLDPFKINYIIFRWDYLYTSLEAFIFYFN